MAKPCENAAHEDTEYLGIVRFPLAMEARVGIGQGLPIHCLKNISFPQHVKPYVHERGTIFLNAEGRSLTVSLTVNWSGGEGRFAAVA